MNGFKGLHRMTRLSFILVPLLLLLATTAVTAASVSLRWDPNDPAPEGYRVFARKSGQAYNFSQPDWEGTATTCTIGVLDGGTDCYFVVRAFDGDLESADSEEVKYTPTVTDKDDDDDGLPDEWEAHFGLDPLSNDADLDLDHDGISNRDEFRAGLEPDERGVGKAPLRPKPLSPKSYSQTDFNVLLDAGGYSDIDGDAHIATHWQVYDAGSEDCLLDVVTDRRLNQLRVPFLLLNGDEPITGGFVSSIAAAGHPHGRPTAIFTDKAADDWINGDGIPDNQEGSNVQVAVTRSLSSAVRSTVSPRNRSGIRRYDISNRTGGAAGSG
jgi:chitinase